MAAATSIAEGLGLPVHDASVVHNSNKLALRLVPCDVLARVAHVGREVAQFEVEVAQRLAASGSPLVALDRRVESRALMVDHDQSPALADGDRRLISDTLSSLGRAIGERGSAEQVVHGEPHPGNLLSTNDGLLFIDLETCCRGPVEFDLAHVSGS